MDQNSLEVFKALFPEESVEQEVSGFFTSDIKKRNTFMGGFTFSSNIEIQPAKECKAIIGKQHILIDTRAVAKKNIKLFLLLIPFGVAVAIYYTLISKNIFFLFISLFLSWPIPLGLAYTYLTGVTGGAGSYLLKKEWVSKIGSDPDLTIDGNVPAGEPYILSQYLAKNNIKIPGILSGRAAWLGTQYPWPFVGINFRMKISKELQQSRLITSLVLIISAVMIWLTIYGIYSAISIFSNSVNF